jgi:gluconate 2-dehydrogenase gamma chain
MPSEPDAPGAWEAGVVFYIDRAVAGYFRALQTLYRAGIQELNDLSGSRFRAAFAELSEVQQDGILAELDGRKREPNPSGDTLQDSDSLLMRFFSVVRDHTIQGMFCDPLYGGNRNGIGWKMIGFPGAQWGYSADQLRPGFDATTIPVQTLNDLQRRVAGDQHA